MSINLLPEQAKKNLQFEELNWRVMFFGEMFFLLLLFLSLLMFGQELFGQWKVRELNQRIANLSNVSEVKEITKFQGQLRLFKNDIERMNRIQEEQLRAFGAIKDLIALIPPVIQLTTLSVDIQAQKIVFSGMAPTRSQLLLLRDKIQKESSGYGDINFPLANLLRETDIPFTFSLTIISKAKQ
ncbi:MAG: hypothetical protein Q7S09_01975 [bacterium]|nr:hypothetical protein [bacterium]